MMLFSSQDPIIFNLKIKIFVCDDPKYYLYLLIYLIYNYFLFNFINIILLYFKKNIIIKKRSWLLSENMFC